MTWTANKKGVEKSTPVYNALENKKSTGAAKEHQHRMRMLQAREKLARHVLSPRL
jgi:hypothetical protein